MFAYVVLLIVLLPVMFFSATIESFFSSDELTEMGIRLENPQATEAPFQSAC